MSQRLLYLIFGQLLSSLPLLPRAPSFKDIGPLVLRHEVAVLNRTNPKPASTGSTERCSLHSSDAYPRCCPGIA
jgi:hypothetical protein